MTSNPSLAAPSEPRTALRRATASLLAGLLALSTLACDSGDQARRASRERPDVFLVVVDTLRKDRLGCYGYERQTSPRLDRIAREGVLFADPNSQASWTRPSMVSLFTGRYLTAYRDVVPPQAPTLAESFARAGYRTIGLVGNVLVSEEAGFARGFEHFDAGYSTEANEELGELGRDAPGLLRALWPLLDGQDEGAPAGERRPLFVYLHLMDPHHPYLPHPQYLEELPLTESAPIDDWMMQNYRSAFDELLPWEERFESWKRIRAGRGRYEVELRFTDEHIGALVDGLEQRGLLAKGLFALVADHGEVLWERRDPKPIWPKDEPLLPKNVLHAEHGWFLTQELIGTPFLLWGHGLPHGLRVETPVENLDLFPTLLELCDLERPAGLNGESLVPWFSSATAAGARPPVHEYLYSFVLQRACVREVATGWKLTLPEAHFAGFGVQPELFDLGADPRERDNRYAEEPEVVARLTRKLQEWKSAHPTVTTAGRELSQLESADLRALGYMGSEEEPLTPAVKDE